MTELWLITLTKFLWDLIHNHIANTQKVICEESTTHFAMTVFSHLTLCVISINYITIFIYGDINKEKDTKIASLKKELKITKSQLDQEKAKKINSRHRKNTKAKPCHPELDWSALTQCFPIQGAHSNFEVVA